MFYLRFYLKVRFVLWSVVDFVVDFFYIYIHKKGAINKTLKINVSLTSCCKFKYQSDFLCDSEYVCVQM